jgi:hypothetical protein
MEQSLADAVADCSMQPHAVPRITVHLPGVRPERRDIAPAQRIRDFRAHVVDVPPRIEGGIAAGDACEDDVGAIAKRDLPVFEHQHHGNDRGGLDDARETRRQRLTAEETPVGDGGAGLDGRQIAVHIARAALGTDDLFHSHRSLSAHGKSPRPGHGELQAVGVPGDRICSAMAAQRFGGEMRVAGAVDCIEGDTFHHDDPVRECPWDAPAAPPARWRSPPDRDQEMRAL